MYRKSIYYLFFFLISFSSFSQEKNAEKIYEMLNGAVVRIYTQHGDGTQHGQASGVIIKKNNWIVTNYHVLGDAEIINAEQHGKYIKLDSIVAFDQVKDILVLHISDENDKSFFKNVPSIKCGNSDQLKVGQKIFAIGSPFGLENTITEGIISGLRTSFNTDQQFMQISAPISQGSSGGAVVNAKGELIGISTMVMEGPTAQNLNFAVLINDVFSVAEKGKIIVPEKQSLDANYYFEKGFKEMMNKNYVTAIFLYQTAISKATKEQGGIMMCYVGMSYYKLGYADSALKYYNKSEEIIEIADNLIGIANIYYDKKEYELSIRYYKKAFAKNPSSVESSISIANTYYKMNDEITALEWIKTTLKISNRNPDAYYLSGKIMRKNKLYKEAISMFEAAILIYPNYADAYYYISDIYLQLGETSKAIEFQQKAFSLNPELRKVTALD